MKQIDPRSLGTLSPSVVPASVCNVSPRGPTWLLRLLTSSTRGHGRVKNSPHGSVLFATPASLRRLLTSGPGAVEPGRGLLVAATTLPHLDGCRGRQSGTLNQTTVTVNNVCHRLRMDHKNQINDGHYSGDCDYDNENNKGDHHYDHDDNDNTVMMNYNE